MVSGGDLHVSCRKIVHRKCSRAVTRQSVLMVKIPYAGFGLGGHLHSVLAAIGKTALCWRRTILVSLQRG